MTRRFRPSGPRAWLVETDDPLGFSATVRAGASGAGVAVVEVVPAERTVLVTVATGDQLAPARRWLAALPATAGGARSDKAIELAVRYDGEDLAGVAEATGLSVAEVIARHTGNDYVSAFCGFAPGFAYLTGLDPMLVLPRRDTPRTRVPAGSVAVAAGYTAVYPSVSPGGWHLLGHTDATLWDLARRPPALLAPGTRVRFRVIG
ncbi:MAG: 5-oxoprolinase subunit B family protein [Desertimonas sp.]